MSKSTKWFLIVFSVLCALGLVFTFAIISIVKNASVGSKEMVTIGSGEKIAVVEVTGTLLSSSETVRQIKEHRENSRIKGILLRINSPGGAVVPSQEIYEEVRKTRDAGKPIVASAGSIAASGGYYVACGATRVVANRGSLVGSIGVVAEFFQVSEAMNKLGIEAKIIKSGKLKDAGARTKPMAKNEEEFFQNLMDDIHRQFIEVVERERKLDHAAVLSLADGRVFTGEQAVHNHLVDTLGTFEDAVAITAALAGIEGKPSLVREVERRSWFDRMFGDVASGVRELKDVLMQTPTVSYRYTGPF